jgi:hypothetical protein
MIAALLLCGCTISIKYYSGGNITNVSPTPKEAMHDLIVDGQEYCFLLTKGYYSEQEAAAGAVKEYGDGAKMADWNDIKSLFGGEIKKFLLSVGAVSNEGIWIAYNGSEYDGTRHYFLAFIDGVTRDDFLKYDDMGDDAWLGSWYDLNLRVFCKIPI